MSKAVFNYSTERVKRVGVSAIVAGSLISATFLSGCAQNYASPHQAANRACSGIGPRALSGAAIGGLGGAAGGAALGGALGGRGGAEIGAGIGLLAGLAAGLAEGHRLDQQDCRAAQVALEAAARNPIGSAVPWKNPTSGNHGEFIATSSEFKHEGRICRRVQSSYYMKGHVPVKDQPGLICRTPQGKWQFADAATPS